MEIFLSGALKEVKIGILFRGGGSESSYRDINAISYYALKVRDCESCNLKCFITAN